MKTYSMEGFTEAIKRFEKELWRRRYYPAILYWLLVINLGIWAGYFLTY